MKNSTLTDSTLRSLLKAKRYTTQSTSTKQEKEELLVGCLPIVLAILFFTACALAYVIHRIPI